MLMTTRRALVALLLGAAVALAACGGPPGTVNTPSDATSETSSPPSSEPAPTDPRSSASSSSQPGSTDPEPSVNCLDVASYEWFGASKEEAIARAEAQGREWRIGREDDQVFTYPDDHLLDRVTFHFDDGVVTFAMVEVASGIVNEGAADPADLEYMGLTRAEAEARAEAVGIPWRTVRVNDEESRERSDDVESRRNFEIDGTPPCDFVTAITRG